MNKTSSQQTFAIDKNVPVPAARVEGSKYPWKQMKVGDSFFIPYGYSKRSGLYGLAKTKGISIRIANQGNGIRVWRVA